MIVENGKIIEATRDELYHQYITENWDNCMPFEEYLWRKKEAGVTVRENDE